MPWAETFEFFAYFWTVMALLVGIPLLIAWASSRKEP